MNSISELSGLEDSDIFISEAKIEGIKTRTIIHPVLQDGYKLTLLLKQRRWHCTNNDCRYENNESFKFVNRSRRSTNATDMMIVTTFRDHVTKQLLEYLKQETMSMCQEESLYQVDLLSPAKVRITDREYWAKRKGQAALDEENKRRAAQGIPPERTEYKTKKDFLRDAIRSILTDSTTFEEFIKKLFEQYGISVHESRGAISFIIPEQEKPIRNNLAL